MIIHILIGLSAPFAFWCWLLWAFICLRLVQLWGEYRRWQQLTQRARYDLILIPSMGGIALYCAIQRTAAIINWLAGAWPANVHDVPALAYLPVGAFSSAGCLFWATAAAFGVIKGKAAFKKLVLIGLLLALTLLLMVP